MPHDNRGLRCLSKYPRRGFHRYGVKACPILASLHGGESVQCLDVFFVQQMMLMGKVRKKARIRNRYDQVPQLDTLWESDKNIRKQGSQVASPFPTGNQKAARNRHDSIALTNLNNK